jgi:hypothetical protein
MDTCPNCKQPVKADQDFCRNCGFNLAKYRQEFFTDRHQKAKNEPKDEASRMARRAVYRQEFTPKKQNSTVAAMISWMRQNATIAFLVVVGLLIITSFSAALGWIVFFILLVWLYIVCDRKQGKIERYTADRRLTEKLNQVGSNVVNSVTDKEDQIKQKHPTLADKRSRHQQERTAIRNKHFGYIQLSAIFTALISLIVVFTGSGAAISEAMVGQHVSVSRVLLGLANRLLSTGNMQSALIIYLIWLLLVLLPIFVVLNLLKNQAKNRLWAVVLSLVESLGLIYFLIRLGSHTQTGTGLFSRVTNQLLTYAVSIGTSTYFLILASLMTTILVIVNLVKNKKSE